MFVHDFAQASAEIGEALARGDLSATRFKVHTLKGVAANLAAGSLQAAAARLEDALQAGEGQQAEPLVEPLSSLLAEALSEAQAIQL